MLEPSTEESAWRRIVPARRVWCMTRGLRDCGPRIDDLPRRSMPRDAGRGAGASGRAQFEAEIRPVLVQTCFPCHGGKKTSGGLKVSSREDLIRGGDRGPAIVPGHPESSLLLQALRHTDEDLKMPPGKRLPDQTRAAFARWIAEGAPWPETVTDSQQAFQASSPSGTGRSSRSSDRSASGSDRMVGSSDRPVHRRRHRSRGVRPVASGRPEDADPSGHLRPDRSAADSRGDRRFPER